MGAGAKVSDLEAHLAQAKRIHVTTYSVLIRITPTKHPARVAGG